MTVLKRTPCVGICSTTYGDLVCRGCKRFAHEIVQWNGFQAPQRAAVWQRLTELREGAVSQFVVVVDREMLQTRARDLQVVEDATRNLDSLVYETLKRAIRVETELAALSLRALGLRARDGNAEPMSLLESIEREFYQRSVARYEHDFHTLAQ